MDEPSDGIRKCLQQAGIDAQNGFEIWHPHDHSRPGAYLLVIRLQRALCLSITRNRYMLERGWYLYAGSAYGPGGISARVRRHVRTDKKLHWHVDRLTAAGSVAAVYALPDGNECAIADLLDIASPFEQAIPGFGSTDCRSCRSHLFRLSPPVNRAARRR